MSTPAARTPTSKMWNSGTKPETHASTKGPTPSSPIHRAQGGAASRASSKQDGATSEATTADASRPRWKLYAAGGAFSSTPHTPRHGRTTGCQPQKTTDGTRPSVVGGSPASSRGATDSRPTSGRGFTRTGSGRSLSCGGEFLRGSTKFSGEGEYTQDAPTYRSHRGPSLLPTSGMPCSGSPGA